MTTTTCTTLLNHEENAHVTIRSGHNSVNNMALINKTGGSGKEGADSLLIDSILTQDETKDVVSMMLMAHELDDDLRLPGFCTSSQMGGIDQYRRPVSPLLSPLTQRGSVERALPGTHVRDEPDMGKNNNVRDVCNIGRRRIGELNRINTELDLAEERKIDVTGEVFGNLPTVSGVKVVKEGIDGAGERSAMVHDARPRSVTMVRFDDRKINGDNMEELPPHLQLTTLKQVKLDDKTLAYQSEYAPFSIFFSPQSP